MEVLFKDSKLHRLCCAEKECVRKWGPVNGKKIMQRLAELRAAETLADFMRLPQARCHALTSDRKGQFAADVKHPRRLILEPADEPVPRRADGAIDPDRVAKVRVIEIIDYHG